MRLDIHLHIESAALQRIEQLLHTIITKEDFMAGELAALQQQVQETLGAEQSAIVLIQGLKQRLDDAIASGDPAQLTALSASLDTSEQALAAAVAANQPPPPPTP